MCVVRSISGSFERSRAALKLGKVSPGVMRWAWVEGKVVFGFAHDGCV